MSPNSLRLPFLVTQHNTYSVVTPNYIHPSFYQKRLFPYSHRVPSSKLPVSKRNSRIIQIGHGCQWSTFLTLTFSPQYYWSDYHILQKSFRSFVKSLYKLNISFKYLAVVEKGGETSRIHYHMLTNIPFNSDIFEHAFHHYRKVCNKWEYGFSDVVPVNNDKCNAVYYLCKYLGKGDEKRPPVGKREVFASKGLNKVTKLLCFELPDYLDNYTKWRKINSSLIFIKKGEENVKNKSTNG